MKNIVVNDSWNLIKKPGMGAYCLSVSYDASNENSLFHDCTSELLSPHLWKNILKAKIGINTLGNGINTGIVKIKTEKRFVFSFTVHCNTQIVNVCCRRRLCGQVFAVTIFAVEVLV